MKIKDKIILGFIAFVATVLLVVGTMFLLRAVNSAALHTKVIQPQKGVECVVVSSTESIAVSCWKN